MEPATLPPRLVHFTDDRLNQTPCCTDMCVRAPRKNFYSHRESKTHNNIESDKLVSEVGQFCKGLIRYSDTVKQDVDHTPFVCG